MRTETRTVRIGEYLGPVDWSYDFAAWGWGGSNPDFIERRVEMLRTLDAEKAWQGGWEATADGGIPRCGWGRVCAVGMYDGWPYWKPTPSVLIAGFLGAEWTSWFGLSEIRRVQA